MTHRKFPDNFIPAANKTDKGKISISEVISLAWDDEISFEQIEIQTKYNERDVIKIMRTHLKPSSFRKWRERVSGRLSKHGVKANK